MRFPPKTILVAFDFTKQALHALHYAERLADKVGARLRAVYVSPWVMPPPDGFFVEPDLSRTQRTLIRAELDRLIGRHGSARVAQGNVADEILKAARSYRADLIVMSSGPRLTRLVHGSMLEAVARRAFTPVICIPPLPRRRAASARRRLLEAVGGKLFAA